ncbi:sigma-70 family RNA polymerase sigma factor [Peptoniphilus catoniae]|uniref:sigma-70 family RNA polymerase sigma factor n=1 Tax=Peptoniphilus catoniae TaxID=1660341 RepID=UPI0010FDF5A8|nr:sigma-70 family RNA polymerase sigma factor [Peptoniphilus catoniae]
MNRNEAFKNLINNREDKLYRIAFSYVKNREDALDCLQAALLKGLENFNTLKDPSYFDSWMVRILINQCLDLIKNKKSDLSFSDEIDPKEFERSPEETIDLINSIGLLSGDQREIIFLRYFMGLNYKEISSKLNLKEGTVKSRLNRSIIKLRELFNS